MNLGRKFKYNLVRILRVNDSPHQVALGFTLGFIPNWYPTFGLGVILSVGLAKLVKSNTVAALVSGVLGAPLWPVLFLLNYKVGSLLFDKSTKVDELEDVAYADALEHTLDGVNSFFSKGFTFLEGALINTLLFSICIYFIVKFLFKMYRKGLLRRIRGKL
ncbi:DUF2062 domain-containing protein [Fredinandcohnia onubensis]|uniref:DUF2062 domain-containing protein n=1 Tax=Fredinandcohnia onubensis TaxID=1571209 RepID=UPI000C0BDDE3|nr:DUF2062 domain-containing protein [Fredinandcohnia onubensis]